MPFGTYETRATFENYQETPKVPISTEGTRGMEAYRRNDDAVTKGTKKQQVGAFW